MAGMVITVGGKPGGGERYKPSESSDMEEGDGAWETGFSAFQSALKSGDAVKAKKAFRLMQAACEGEGEDEEEAPTSERM